MANVQRHRYGEPNVEVVPVASATAISIGDLLWYDASDDTAKPASSYTWNTDLATTQGTFKDVFCGVALSAHVANDTKVTTVRVATAGVHEFDCASATFDLGTFIGPAKQTGDLLEAQKVVAVANATLAIAKPSRVVGTAATKVHVRIDSTIHGNGVQTVT